MVRVDDKPAAAEPLRMLEPAPQMRVIVEARRRRIRRIAAAVAVVVAVALLATVGTTWARYTSAGRAIATRTEADAALRTALSSATPEPADRNILIVLRGPQGSKDPSAAALLRVSEQAGRVWALVVPPEARLVGAGSEAGTVEEVLDVYGPAALVRRLASLSAQPIDAYLDVDASSLARSLESTASSSGGPVEQLLGALRSVGSADGIWETFRARLRLALALEPRAASTLSIGELQDLARGVHEAAGEVQVESVPTVSATGSEVLEATALKALAAQMRRGGELKIPPTVRAEDVDPSSVSVTVWNGAGIGGIAAEAADRLRRAGYDVRDVTNASQFVYDKTLVVYRSESESAARRLVLDLRAGNAVPRRGMYLFDTDLLVVVGKDWPAVR